MSNFSIEIDDKKFFIDKSDVDIDKGNPITKIEVSPNEEYLVIYSEDESIVGWNISDTNKEKHSTVYGIKNMDKICVSDDKKLVYICNNKLEIIDMNNNTQKIKLYYDDNIYQNHCTFNVKGEFVICNEVSEQKKILRIYSTEIKNNKWKCKQNYGIPQDYELINISKYNKLYLLLSNCIYEWDIETEKNVRIFADEENDEFEKRDIKISRNERFICLRIKYEKINGEEFENEKIKDKNKIIIYSIELEIPIATLNLNDGISDIWNSTMKYYWKICLDQNYHSSKAYRPEFFSSNIQIATKYAFGILDDDFLKIKFEEKLSLKNYDELSNENDKTIIECWNMYLNSDERDDVNKIKNTFKHVNILLFKPYQDILCVLLLEVKKVIEDVSPSNYASEGELIHNTIKWKIRINDYKIVLQVFKIDDHGNKWRLICKRIEKHNFGKGRILGMKLIDNNDIVILTTVGLFVYYFNEYNISLSYFYYLDLNRPDNYEKIEKIFSKTTLPLPIHDSFKLNGWALSLVDNKLALLKYGGELLTFAIENNNLELIEDIYKNCMNYFKQDLRNNGIFLNIITSKMLLLKNHFPTYIGRYLSETDLIIDSPSYSIVNQARYTFPAQLDNLTNSSRQNLRKFIEKCILSLDNVQSPSITFLIPYIKFVNYPQDYNFWSDFFLPEPSLFVEIVSKDIYKSLSIRELINFKWISYGFVNYLVILVGHLYLALYFFIAISTVISNQSLNENLNAHEEIYTLFTIIFGFLFLVMSLRRFLYKIYKIFQNLLFELELIFDMLWNLFAILMSFAIAFYILLSPKSSYSLDELTVNDDDNNPWNLIPTYQVFENGTLNSNFLIRQNPDENTNRFTSLYSSFFAACLLLSGDTSSFSNWTFAKNLPLTILMILFIFIMVIYILNVFITLFGEALNEEEVEASYWKMKAEFISEIELFYLSPRQRRWQIWFPEVLYFNAKLDEAHEKIEKLINEGKWNTNEFPEMKQELLNKLRIQQK
ncbi:hypothetical protein GLOIN_2v1874143 [Rhizophagus clarus]|uniref:Ion transport domain-containing protein n=1 Tax=Rhizophagus clarus TaxID=94130 RepID=A0A8H3LLL0_9GLOM|nr:hypothetical protein GLOIN_2v1874143 [Rhizophagus clarus]